MGEIDVEDDAPRPADPVIKADIPDTPSRTVEGKIWTREDKMQAVSVFLTTGNTRTTATKLGMDRDVLRRWMASKWWPVALAEMRAKFEEELTAEYGATIRKANLELMERLNQGDVKLNRKGKQVRVPVGARDLALIAAISFDKRQIIRGEPTSIRGARKTAEDRANELRGKAKKKDPPASASGNVTPIRKENV